MPMNAKRNTSPSFVFLFFLLIGISFLFSGNPLRKEPQYQSQIDYIQIKGILGFHVNRDAFGFVGAAIQPSSLMVQNHVRQSRPVYILAGSALGHVVYLLATPFHGYIYERVKLFFPAETASFDRTKSVKYVCVYIGFVLLNLLIALGTLTIFLRLLKMVGGAWQQTLLLKYAFVLLLFSNQITQQFTWTVHTQHFNLFVPLFTLYLAILIATKKVKEQTLPLIYLLSGILFLAYGNFILIIPVFLLSLLMRYSYRPSAGVWLKLLVLYPLIFFSPLLIWQAFLRINGVEFHSSEYHHYRQFVWLSDAAKQGWSAFVYTTGSYLGVFLKTTAGLLFPLLLWLGVRFYPWPKTADKQCNTSITQSYRILGTALAIVTVLFLAFLGYYADRLTIMLQPLLVLSMAVHVNRSNISRRIQWLIALLILLWHIYIIIFGVPYFYNSFYK